MKRDIRISGTFERVVRASADDDRDWLVDAPVCRALASHGIVHVGLAEVVHPYEVRRPDLSGTFIMACSGGEGRIWLEGAWHPMRPGEACLAPPRSFHAYRAVPGMAWRIIWVRYQEPIGAPPFVNARAPLVAPFDGAPLEAAVAGLHAEAAGTASPAAMRQWADLVQHYAQAFADPWRTDDRLGAAWQAVAARLDGVWSVSELARIAGMGPKQFTRLCRDSLGRTPAQHLATLRLQEAARLLATTDDKVEVIAREVGYQSLFTFSHAFKKVTGFRPSEYRKR